MTQTASQNRRCVLAERPHGTPTVQSFRLDVEPIPTAGRGQMLLRTLFLSLDPYMRGRMSDAPSYAPPVAVGATMLGGTIAEVVASNLAGFAPGDTVLGTSGWQDYALSDGSGITNLGSNPQNPSWALGVLGMPGFTGWAALREIGRPQPGETLVVAAATGPVGATVGQIASLWGCKTIGIAGGPEKCAFATKTLGFGICLDHRAGDFAAQLKAATPNGIDIYFENVGGKVFDAVLPLLNPHARIPVCGVVSQYNATSLPEGPDRLPLLMSTILRKKLTVRGFIIFDDFAALFPEFRQQMQAWIAAGKIHYREDVTDGLENAPAAFLRMLSGESFGKSVVRVGLAT